MVIVHKFKRVWQLVDNINIQKNPAMDMLTLNYVVVTMTMMMTTMTIMTMTMTTMMIITTDCTNDTNDQNHHRPVFVVSQTIPHQKAALTLPSTGAIIT